jgi:hypothetical protein
MLLPPVPDPVVPVMMTVVVESVPLPAPPAPVPAAAADVMTPLPAEPAFGKREVVSPPLQPPAIHAIKTHAPNEVVLIFIILPTLFGKEHLAGFKENGCRRGEQPSETIPPVAFGLTAPGDPKNRASIGFTHIHLPSLLGSARSTRLVWDRSECRFTSRRRRIWPSADAADTLVP